ncbi:hypothetical protein CS063_14265 [Sporanaerobium hydrogeniformans]|uniref:Uncharacterized protein n=1 Tax=Sporanaerobium hydrogeniformans TaxID=3072179 RepID=A0AC61DA36_9FIRM|nr:UvrD-helicase domain-containing protein [Sporanaerobium hydrogeniformans]PHV69755.1 hypothetical protein CS063_14265 [Sporanaerobium hydrogeniformans]
MDINLCRDEKEYLQLVQDEINSTVEQLDELAKTKQKEIFEAHKYVVQNHTDMDAMEIFSNNKIIANDIDNLEKRTAIKSRLERMRDNTYFGRIDFLFEGDASEDVEAYYIGLGDFTSDKFRETLVYDWRAPISSMYYDYEIGPASYQAPIGDMCGEITKKKQYKVKNGQLVYVLDNEIRIADEILQKELSHNADNRMKNIVATIQKEQNAIVRNDKARIMIVQGIAGSGKTSIALHRIAYLIYQSRHELNSNNILIISPNPIFSDYISNVLPELGEENIRQYSIQELIADELKEIVKVESKFEQIEFLLSREMEGSNRKRNIDYKQSEEFFGLLQHFVEEFPEQLMAFKDISLEEICFSKEEIKHHFCNRFTGRPLLSRAEDIANYLAESKEGYQGLKITKLMRKQIKVKLMGMFKETELVSIYERFIGWCNEVRNLPFILEMNKECLAYEDVFPMIYLKYALSGYTGDHKIKHLVIDEMQDYTRVEFEILKRLFNCKMTILGDIYQVLEPKETNVLDTLKEVFEEAELIRMNRTYRSTFEIATFGKKIINQTEMIPFERHGEAPQLKGSTFYSKMLEEMLVDLKELDLNQYTTVAIICKTLSEAKKVYNDLSPYIEVTLLTTSSTVFTSGIIITTSYLAKGLEFDVVFIPSVNEKNYYTPVDKQVLYVSCTRALHLLHIYYDHILSPILES